MEEVIGLELCVNEYNFKYFLCGLNLFIYSPDNPLSCWARVWIETYNPVIVDKNWDEKIL